MMETVTKTVYRGTCSTGIEGVTWWSTDYKLARKYARKYINGFVMKRIIKLPINEDGYYYNPSDYIIGTRYSDYGGADIEGFYYALSDKVVHVNDGMHFNICIHHTILNSITVDADILVR